MKILKDEVATKYRNDAYEMKEMGVTKKQYLEGLQKVASQSAPEWGRSDQDVQDLIHDAEIIADEVWGVEPDLLN